MPSSSPRLCTDHATRLRAIESLPPSEVKLLRMGGLFREAKACRECARLRTEARELQAEGLGESDWNEAEVLLMGTGRSPFSYCFPHVGQLAAITRTARLGQPSEQRMRGLNEEADRCPECLANRWNEAFLETNSKLPRVSPIEHLHAAAQLKATFPGYPREQTPREDCASVEEYLLKEGAEFPVAAFHESELPTLQSLLDDLKRRVNEMWEEAKTSEFTACPPPYSDHGSSFAIAQRVWFESRGNLRYVEGIAMPAHARERYYGQVACAWNLLNGKVVDLLAGGPGKVGFMYFGVVLDSQLSSKLKDEQGTSSLVWGESILFPGASTLMEWREAQTGSHPT